MYAVATDAGEVYIQDMGPNPGLITEKISPLTISHTSWRIVQKVDMKSFLDTPQQLHFHLQSIKHACSSLGNECIHQQHLQSMETRLTTAAAEASKATQLIKIRNPSKITHLAFPIFRKKRALISIVGQAFHFLFGTGDEASEEEIRQLVLIKANDTHKLSNLLANQTQIIDTKFLSIENDFQKLSQTLNKLQQNEEKLFHNQIIESASEILAQDILQFEIDTNEFTDTILFATQGIIHPRLMSLNQLSETARMVKSMLPDTEFPPIYGQNSFENLVKISSLSIYFIDNWLTYILQIPLLDQEKFTLYKATPFPILQNFTNSNIVAYIWPKDEYFAINNDNTSYLSMQQDILESCKILNTTYICTNTQPIKIINEQTMCEIRIAANYFQYKDQCNIKLQNIKDTYWYRLHKSNKWIFSTTKEEFLFVSCKSNTHTLFIKNTGILTLIPGCSARTSTVRLIATEQIEYKSDTRIFGQTSLNITEYLHTYNISIDTLSQVFTNSQEIPYMHTSLHNLETGTELKQIITKARELGEYEPSIFNYLQQQESTVYRLIIYAILALIILWILCKLPILGGLLTLIDQRLISGNHPNTPTRDESPQHMVPITTDLVMMPPATSVVLPPITYGTTPGWPYTKRVKTRKQSQLSTAITEI